MLGLYDRDYNELSVEEEQAKEAVDASERRASGAKFGRKNFYYKYPEAVRRYLSLFPNNLMDIALLKDTDTLNQQCDEFEKLINDPNITELNIKRYIQDNKYYHIPASIFSRFNFGHHEAALFKEFQLGTSFKADYLLAGRGSGGWQFVFVEFENPYNKITLGDGNFGETVRKGINQINDWKSFIEAYYSTISAEYKKYTKKDLPSEFTTFDSTRMHYVVVAGRRIDFDKTDSARLHQRRNENDNHIMILHYDNLLDDARRLIGANTY